MWHVVVVVVVVDAMVSDSSIITHNTDTVRFHVGANGCCRSELETFRRRKIIRRGFIGGVFHCKNQIHNVLCEGTYTEYI